MLKIYYAIYKFILINPFKPCIFNHYKIFNSTKKNIMPTKYQIFKDNLAQSASENKIELDSITLIAASKYYGASQVKNMFEQGQVDFGENRLQDAIPKIDQLKKLPLKWHFFGHIQTNKAKKIVEYFSIIHSLDSLKLAHSLNSHALDQNKILEVFIQVNLAKEEKKSGFTEETLTLQFKEIDNLSNIKIQGLMIITPYEISPLKKLELFKNLRNLENKINILYNKKLKYLSMGMSDDWQEALKEGATHLRIGRALY